MYKLLLKREMRHSFKYLCRFVLCVSLKKLGNSGLNAEEEGGDLYNGEEEEIKDMEYDASALDKGVQIKELKQIIDDTNAMDDDSNDTNSPQLEIFRRLKISRCVMNNSWVVFIQSNLLVINFFMLQMKQIYEIYDTNSMNL